FDVVHFHNASLAGGPGAFSLGDGVKLYTAHEYWLVCPTHMLWKLDRAPCVEPTCLRCTLSYHRPPQLWRYTRLLARSLKAVDVVLVPSLFSLEAHRQRGLTVPMRHLPYFVGEEEAVASPPGPAEERPYFLFVGRLERLKGVQLLIEQFKTYRDADLLIAGEGRYGRELRRMAQELEHVRFLGSVHPVRLRKLYAGAIALLVPSLWYEVFGIVVLEAFAQGTPAVVSDQGALPEIVEQSEGGLVYRSPGDLLEALRRLRQDGLFRDALGGRGRDAWQRLWSEEPHLTRYLAIIHELAEVPRARSYSSAVVI
ncbi:MAG: glycosyl transferase family 1, partial [Candidatus Rokuibacteriota bacterium]